MNNFHRFYIGLCATVGVGFAVAAFAGYRVPDFGIVNGMNSGNSYSSGGSYGRSSGGFWGGGK